MDVNAYSVSQINEYIGRVFDYDLALQNISIMGEISNYKPHYSGHMYFTLKDDNSKLKCIMFKGSAQYLNFKPKDGDKVIAKGSIRVFERDGQYQLYVSSMANYGLGDLYLRYEQLKARLESRGFFDNKNKKPLPYIPDRIGIVTSATGAAIRDIISVITRRWDNANIVIFPVAVQGENAGQQIAAAIDYFNDKKNVDVIITGRGGGSIEELWAFNEEIVANSIFKSSIPVISAVGHETDFTISDFVADLRAATPSAAAELVIPDKQELLNRLKVMEQRLTNNMNNGLALRKRHLTSIGNSYGFRQPYRRVEDEIQALDNLHKSLISIMEDRLTERREESQRHLRLLSTLSPLQTLQRGFTIARELDPLNKTITSVKELEIDKSINLMFHDGQAEAMVKKNYSRRYQRWQEKRQRTIV